MIFVSAKERLKDIKGIAQIDTEQDRIKSGTYSVQPPRDSQHYYCAFLCCREGFDEN